MADDEITLLNRCTDLVSLRNCEAFPLQLLGSKQAGEWVCVRAFCQQIGVAAAELAPEFFVAWLPDPMALDGYAVIMFYDNDSKWSMAVHFNRGRFLGGTPPNQPLLNLHSHSELETTCEKLRLLEERFEANQREQGGDEHLRELSMRSLERLINQLKEEIGRFEARSSQRTVI